MIELKWAIFQEKFSGKEQDAFEALAYELFCQEHNRPFGIHSYENQTGIEADPIKIGDDYIGFQAKFLKVKPSKRKSKLIEAFQSAKKKNSELTKVLFYINQPFAESPFPNQKKSQIQIEIEDEAKKLDINLVWKVPSQLKIQLSQPENQRIYNRYFSRLTLPSSKEILEKFKLSSFQLQNINQYFEGLVDSHIPRKETRQLLKWIKKPLGKAEKGIILLEGNAGYGKSVIIKDLYDELNSTKIPVLGIKADKYYPKTKKELQEQLDFDLPIEILVETLAVTNDSVIILIDQLDALSQSMSAKREYLDSFLSLINSFASISDVRIIISVRTYDLNYDTSLRNISNQKSIKVGVLDPQDVQQVLKEKKIDQEQINPKLLELIRVPHHLNVLCKVSSGNQTLDGIQTLHDLYNELWHQKITKYTHGSLCKEALYEIASHMYKTSSINLSKFKIDQKYFTSVEYLKSNGLLVESKGEIQFFHQTFFDYCFAKQFVDSGQSIEKYILSNHQGLYIRASLKMIMSFLRDHDLEKYIKILQRVLEYSKFRFQIKVLLVTELGYREDPNDSEKNFVRRKILSNKIWKDIFMEAINTSSWLDFLNESGELKKLISEEPFTKAFNSFGLHVLKKQNKTTEVRLNQLFNLFKRLLPTCRQQILQILFDLPEFTDKAMLIFRLLYFIKKWDHPLATHLFEKYADDEIVKDTHGFYSILEDASRENLNWTLKVYGEYLTKKIKSQKTLYDKPKLSYDDSELFKKIFEIDLEQSFDFTLNLVKSINKRKLNNENELKLNFDLPYFFSYPGSNRNDYEEVLQLLIDKSKQLYFQNPNKYKEFVSDHLNDHSLTILVILIISLQDQPETHKELIVELLKSYSDKGGFEISSKAGFYVRQLISKSYAHFTDEQRQKVNDLVLSILPERDCKVYINREGKKYHYLRWSGGIKYEYLCAIPHNLLINQPLIKKVYQELERKFGQFKEDKPQGSVLRAVPPPLSSSAYENMNFEQWENSFMQYDEEQFHGNGPLNGSKVEHSRAFEKQVAERPQYFAALIERLIEEDKVDHNYIISGLDGLVKGEYDTNEFKKLFKKALNLRLDSSNIRMLLLLISYLINTKNCDDEVITFLCNTALNHEDPADKEELENSIQYGINTVRGLAVSKIPYLFSYPDHRDLVFDTVDRVLDDFSVGVKATLMPQLHYLMDLDKERTLKVLLRVTEQNEIEVLKHTLRSAQCLAEYFFKELEPYFKTSLDHKEMHGDSAVILALLWIDDQQQCYGLLKKFLKKNEEARSKMVDVAIHNLFNENPISRKRAEKLFLQFLDSKDEKVIQEYSTAFLHLKDKGEDCFMKIHPLLVKYSKSNVVKRSPHYFYEYLLSNAKKYPKECIDLLSQFKNYDKPDISKSGYYNDDPVKILLGAYNSLRSVGESDYRYKEKSIKIFDQLLKDDRFRQSANNVTDQADS
ncbi:hypothetical protein GCM10011506_29930 [Marivirga lumbricoides]|uniref:ATPase AAA-type core domain-containing protein n=1 Tax=Marivirga lumbricoides TaxID=1046115 RepID=A0ABQ1MP64_9BACT|nr:hypothetical protein GCM10011506_29930 [Marivirga lumbricoides]